MARGAKNQQAGTLSGGEQQMLALARGFLTKPRLMMLDEPSLGLAPLGAREVFHAIEDLNRKEGVAVLVVEQNATLALSAASRAYVLETGAVAITGTTEALRSNDAVRTAYRATDAAVRNRSWRGSPRDRSSAHSRSHSSSSQGDGGHQLRAGRVAMFDVHLLGAARARRQ